jgi:DNA invertase Pin-like site-specific DNA recombinase
MTEVTQTSGRVAAIYARVSSERQRQDQTIASQTVGLRELAAERGLLVTEDLVFEDEGFSGASLQRPALERLRDRAAEGAFEILLCHAPDRLARRYAYQVLLLEEFARVGVEVCFAKEPERGGTPEDELLRQFQGMIAEYERAQIRERTRRGKLHRARTGHQAVLSCAPYGYRYVKKSEHSDGFWEIDPVQAEVVREVFERYINDAVSIGELARWLSERGIPTRTGKAGMGPLERLGDAAQHRLPRAGSVREDENARAARQADADYPSTWRAPRPSPRARGPARGQLDVDRGAGDRQRRDVRARSSPPLAERALRQTQHQEADTAAGHPRLPRVRLRLLPEHDPHDHQADLLLPVRWL